MENDKTKPGILSGIKVLDVAHGYAGALVGSLLADLGADVLCIEHPAGHPLRQTSPKSQGQALWWKNVARGKRCISLNLSSQRGQQLLRKLAPKFEVMIENFRPGTLERWNLGPEDLQEAGASLSLLRISGYGQTGPMKDRPGFGSAAEAFSGFCYLNGFPDGPPVFPSIAIGDGVAAAFGAFGLMAALASRLRTNKKGVEVVDMALFEGLFRLSPVQMPAYSQLGVVMKRPGNSLVGLGVLRNLYKTRDGQYFVVSTVGTATIRRLIVCAEVSADLVAQLDSGVLDRSDEEMKQFILACDKQIAAWAARNDLDEVVDRLETSDTVYERVYTTVDIVNDKQYRLRDDVVSVADPDLGEVLMPGIVPKFSGHAHAISSLGPKRIGAHNAEVYAEYFGFDEQHLTRLSEEGVI